MKTRLFRSDFSFPKVNFAFVTTACIEVVKKWNGPNNKQIYLIDRTIALISASLQVIAN